MHSEKENFVRVLERRNPSRVPYPLPVEGTQYGGAWPSESRPSEEAREWLDEWGVLWRDAEGEVFPVRPAVESFEHIDELQPPDPDAPGRMDKVAEKAESVDRESHFFSLGHPYFLYEKAINIVGPDQLGICMLAAPAKAHQLLDTILDFELGIAARYVEFGPDSIGFSDDYGHQDRLAMSPECWRTFFKPRLRRASQFYRERLGPEVRTNLHSCGHVTPILPDLVELGLATVHPVQSTANDLAEARRLTSGTLTLAGCIDGQRILPLGGPEDVREEVRRKLDLLWENGGYLPMPEKTHGVPPENIRAMEEAIREWSRRNVEG